MISHYFAKSEINSSHPQDPYEPIGIYLDAWQALVLSGEAIL